MKNVLSFLFVFVLLSLNYSRAQVSQITALDSISVELDASAPSANLVSNDQTLLAGIDCYAVKINNWSSHDIAVGGTVFSCNSQYAGARLDMNNIYVTAGNVYIGKINSWSLNSADNKLGFYFPNLTVVGSHSAVVLHLRSDLYGWGTFKFLLMDLALADVQTSENKVLHFSQNWGAELLGYDIALANTDHLRLSLGVYPNGWDQAFEDTLYVLPGQYVYSSAYCEMDRANYISQSISAFKSGVIISSNLLGFGNFNFSQPWAQYLEELGHVTFASDDLSQTVSWTASSTSNGIDYFNLSWVSGYNTLALGGAANIHFYVEGVLYNQFCAAPVSSYISHNRVLKSVDGILGDYDGDGLVLENDADEMQQVYTTYGGFMDYYSKDGHNAGRASILFDGATLSDIFLIRVWLNDPNDRLVKDLGIGQPMSARTKPIQAAYSKTISGSQIVISTKAFAVRISAILPSGKLWSSSSQVSGDKAIFTVPDQSLDYRVEAVSLAAGLTDVGNSARLPADFQLDQNYPNPFNPSTSISYSLPERAFVTLKIYDILGREVASLVNEEKQAGRYQIRFDASNLASGTYVYRLAAGNFIQTKKMVLMK